jgi:spore coat protein U-like protein
MRIIGPACCSRYPRRRAGYRFHVLTRRRVPDVLARLTKLAGRRPLPRLRHGPRALRLPTVVACLWCLFTVTPAGAQTCTVTMPAMAFGNIDVLAGAAVNATSTITVTCRGGSAAGQRLCISMGVGSAGDATSREMPGPGANLLRHDLYTDAARTHLWGSWQTGYDTAGVQLNVARGSTTPVTIYGKVFGSQQTVAAGSYSSTFTANPFVQYANTGGAPCPTGAKSASTSTTATATVLSSCNVSATNLNFGTASVLTGNVDATSSLSVQCSNALPYTVALNGGNSGAVNPTQRKMANGPSQITYGLYRDAARTLPWGSTMGTNTASGTGTGLIQALTVYGRVAAQTTPAPGVYQDTIVVTVTY